MSKHEEKDKEISLTNKEDALNISVPNDFNKNDVLVKIFKQKDADDKKQKFRSFSFPVMGGNFTVGTKSIHVSSLLDLLQKNGLSKLLPINVGLGSTLSTLGIDWQPLSYMGPKVWYFQWSNVECSITSNEYKICIRVHDMTPGLGEKIMTEISEELLKYWKSPTKLNEMSIYIAKDFGPYFQWAPLCTKLHRDMHTIYIDPRIKDKLVKQLEKFFDSGPTYDKYGVTYKRIHLFYGPPGTGKTSTVLALASMFGKNIAKLSITPTLDSAKLEVLFQTIPQNTFLLLEDVDALFVEREAKTSIDFSTVLNCMDGITTSRGLVMFMTTNHLSKLDKALVRPGRVDMCLEFEKATRDVLAQALKVLGEDYENEHEEFLNRHGDGMTIAELQKHLFDCIMEEKDSIL